MLQRVAMEAKYRKLRAQLRHARWRVGPPSVELLLEGRARFEAMGDLVGVPEGAECTPVDAGGVPAEWTSVQTSDPERVLLYLHGGGYAMGSVNASRKGLTQFVEASGLTGFNVDYRLAPEDPFPAAVDDAVAAYRWLVRHVPPERIVLLGESAGGGLAIAALVALRDAGDPLPAGAATVSAWADLSLSGDSYRRNARRDLALHPVRLGFAAQQYLAGADPRHPLASPVYADLSGLPPLLLLASRDEIVTDDTLTLARRVTAAGGHAEVLLAPRMLHCWTGYCDMVHRAAGDVAALGRWLAARAGATAPTPR